MIPIHFKTIKMKLVEVEYKRPLMQRIIRSLYWRRNSRLFSAVYPAISKNKVWFVGNRGRIALDNPTELMQRACISKGCYEPEIEYLIKLCLDANKVFWDVGANIGIHTVVAASVGAKVYAFEPIPELHGRLKRNLEINGFGDMVMPMQLALGAVEHEASMYRSIREDDGSHSIIAPVSDSWTKIDIKVVSADDLLNQGFIEVPHLIKIDVEGYEARVLDGISRLLSSEVQPFLIVETGDRLAIEINESAVSALRRLFERDYLIYRITSVSDSVVLQEVGLEHVSALTCNYFACPMSRVSEFHDLCREHDAEFHVAEK